MLGLIANSTNETISDKWQHWPRNKTYIALIGALREVIIRIVKNGQVACHAPDQALVRG